ncbi:MAG: hypothetical protein LBE23_00060 [Vagococcus sp.]|jgi:hypothetical protein|nr:hypothetical protein [Vagococcus sp.]
MRESKIFKGYWFLPENPENEVAGILSFEPNNKITLELIGGFESPENLFDSFGNKTLKKEQIIWGRDDRGTAITLIDCHKYGSYNFSSSFPMIKYTGQYIIEGIHLSGVDEKVFFKIRTKIPLLTNWIGRSGVSFSMPIGENDSFDGFDIRYRNDEIVDKVIKLSSETTFVIQHQCQVPEFTEEEILIKEYYDVQIETDNEYNFQDLLDKINRFKDFLTFCCMCELDFIEINLSSHFYMQQLKSGSIIYHNIGLYYGQIKPSLLPENRKEKKFLLKYHDIEADYQSIIKRWFEFDHNMYPIVHHLLDSITYKPMFKSTDFLIVCQALEGFHIRFIDEKKGVERSLESRIKNLIGKFREVKNIIKINPKLVGDSRNYYSHLYLEDNRQVLKDVELYHLTKRLRVLLICCFFNILGISMERIKEIIN